MTPLLAFRNRKATEAIRNDNPKWMEEDTMTRRNNYRILQFYMNLPKYMSNALGLSGGERMYLSRTDDDVCALSRKWHGDSDIPVTLSESVTRRYNGRKYTIIRFPTCQRSLQTA